MFGFGITMRASMTKRVVNNIACVCGKPENCVISTSSDVLPVTYNLIFMN